MTRCESIRERKGLHLITPAESVGLFKQELKENDEKEEFE